ncbi:MAG: pyridoxamine 5'-phosphate oxidase family protein [Elainellaceae cyanobacterium]
MAKFYPDLTEALQEFIRAQRLFFTATAPNQGQINISPKGIDTFRCIDSKTVAYLDLTGSGNETAAHLHENGRMTLMFCSFSETPMILRLYGQGQVIYPRDHQWLHWYRHFNALAGERQIIALAIDAVQTSCGFGVPIFDFNRERGTLVQWAANKGEEGLQDYWREKNQTSIDGLPTKILTESRHPETPNNG